MIRRGFARREDDRNYRHREATEACRRIARDFPRISLSSVARTLNFTTLPGELELRVARESRAQRLLLLGARESPLDRR